MFQTQLFHWIGIVLLATAALSNASAEDLFKREGKHIRLTTDLTSTAETETLVASFDAAVGQWIEFWNLPPDAFDQWKVDAFVIRNKSRFEREGLIPARVPDFPFGYSMDGQIWVLAQPSEYYTRHLLLHEGVHAIAFFFFRGAGSTWFQEGTAELLATHSGQGADVKVNQIPPSREAVPYWGRFKLMDQLREESKVPTLARVMQYRPDLEGDVEAYGWSWAAAMMFSEYPEYRPVFIQAARDGRIRGPRFNHQFQRKFADLWPILEARWRLMCHGLDYGFDWSREKVELSADDPLWDGKPIQLAIAADRGWQSMGVRVPGGVRVRVAPSGRITLAQTTKPWESEAAGITFQYHRGRPLGQLMMCVLPNAIDSDATSHPPLQIHSIETETTIELSNYSWLLWRVNDAAGAFNDNQGEFQVTISVATR